MTDNNPKTPGSRRVCDRLNVARKILLELDTGEILVGKTVDISPRGALIQTDAPAEGDLPGATGTLFIVSDEGQFSIGYPCKVARQEGSSVALEVDKKAAAAFGNFMAKALLGF
jgi:hypothetical protein